MTCMVGRSHHWKIAPPTSMYSHGICAKCGEEREFCNASVDELPKSMQQAMGWKAYRLVKVGRI